MTDERDERDFGSDTQPGPWGTEEDCPTEVDPQTELEREEESRKTVAFFESFLRSLDLKRLRERRQRELVSDRHSDARDFVAYASSGVAPPRAANYDRIPRAKVLLEAGTDDRTAPTVVLPSSRPYRWRLGGMVMITAAVMVCWLLVRSHPAASEPQGIVAPRASLVPAALTGEPLPSIRPAAASENGPERGSEPRTTMTKDEKSLQRKSDRATAVPMRAPPSSEVASASSAASSSDPIGDRIISW